MSKTNQNFSVGDWIVHHTYGVGQIEEIEKKKVNKKKKLFYRVKTEDSIFWVPVKETDTDRIRPLTSTSSLKRAIRILKKPPKEMASNYKKRVKHIQKLQRKGTLSSICRLVRDLSARERYKTLNNTERRALSYLRDLLLREWSVCIGITIEDARQEMKRLLKEGQAKSPAKT